MEGKNMKFDWSGLTEIDFVNYCAKMENDMCLEDDFIGCIRVGELCFDILVQRVGYDAHQKQVLIYDLYVGGVDTGYGESRIEPGYPYDYADGGCFNSTLIYMTYEDFQKHVEEELETFIKTWNYSHASLLEKANAPLHIW
jgi:hypothetical protein